MRQVTVDAAKTHRSRLIEAAVGGGEVVIATGGKPVVRLVPVVRRPFRIGMLAGQLGAVPDFLAPTEDDELDPREAGGS